MATYKNGPTGSFSGKLGPVVGASWRDIEVLRSAPQKSSKPPTEAQLLQRGKFKVAMAFLTPMASLFTKTFKAYPTDKGGFEVAKSYHLTEAMQLNEGQWEMLISKVLVSSGNLRGLTDPMISTETEQTLYLQWTDDSGQAMANAIDKIMFVMYMPTLNHFEVFKDVAKREDGSAVIAYPEYYQGVEAHCWATFGTSTGGKYSVSTYLGQVGL